MPGHRMPRLGQHCLPGAGRRTVVVEPEPLRCERKKTNMSTTRAFGDTGMNLTPLGLGTWVMAGAGWEYSWGATEDADSIAAIRHAVSSGLNWLDTAPAYGLGHAEELVGRALADIPESDRPYIFTKTGLIWGEGDDRSGPPRRVMRPEIVRAELENSLRRLRVDHIDLYQV